MDVPKQIVSYIRTIIFSISFLICVCDVMIKIFKKCYYNKCMIV